MKKVLMLVISAEDLSSLQDDLRVLGRLIYNSSRVSYNDNCIGQTFENGRRIEYDYHFQNSDGVSIGACIDIQDKPESIIQE